MLTKLFGRQTCAACQWCCTFDQNDQWETPLIIAENAAPLRRQFPDAMLTPLNNDYKLDLSMQFEAGVSKEYVLCPFLDCKSGCRLTEEEKPFDCKIWPFRLMRKAEQLVLALTPTCPACNAMPMEKIRAFAEEGIAAVIKDYADRHPGMILPYREGYPVLVVFA